MKDLQEILIFAIGITLSQTVGSFVVTDRESGLFVVTENDKAATVTPVTLVKESRPVVRMYWATWCGPCHTAKAALKGAKLPFDIEYIDASNGGQPSWCGSLPAFAWAVNGQTRYVLGWPGVATLVGRWESSQKPPVKATVNNYRPSWTWPGELRQHLRTTHGVDEASRLTQDQAERLHDALHGGHARKHDP